MDSPGQAARSVTNTLRQQALCGRHHWLVHEGGWQIVFAKDGRSLIFKPPPRVWNYARGPDSPRAA
jgi:hypothetical protein